jgi:hypothetical protein
MDERELIEFEVPRILSEVFPDRASAPGELRRCSQCGTGSRPLPADQLTVIKHRHDTQPLGHLRLYCPTHAAEAREWLSSGSKGSGRVGPVCPSCNYTAPVGTRICDICGQQVPT